MVDVAAVIMAVPERRGFAQMLYEELNAQDQRVVAELRVDVEHRGTWPMFQECLRESLKYGASHTMIVQDDVILCPSFSCHLLDAIEARPEEILSLFGMTRKIKEAYDRGFLWGAGNAVWGQANIFTRHDVESLLKWSQANVRPDYKHDDSVVSLWCLANGKTVYTPIPTLVQHRELKSTVGNPLRPGGRDRLSPAFLGTDATPARENRFSDDLRAYPLIQYSLSHWKNDWIKTDA